MIIAEVIKTTYNTVSITTIGCINEYDSTVIKIKLNINTYGDKRHSYKNKVNINHKGHRDME
jgi:hypothetical protein